MSSAPARKRREILQHRADRTVGGDLVIGRERGLGIGLGEFGRLAHAREMAIAGGALGGDLGEGRLGFGMLAGFGQRARGLEGGADLGRLLGFPPVVAAPGRDRRHERGRPPPRQRSP